MQANLVPKKHTTRQRFPRIECALAMERSRPHSGAGGRPYPLPIPVNDSVTIIVATPWKSISERGSPGAQYGHFQYWSDHQRSAEIGARQAGVAASSGVSANRPGDRPQ